MAHICQGQGRHQVNYFESSIKELDVVEYFFLTVYSRVLDIQTYLVKNLRLNINNLFDQAKFKAWVWPES